MKRLLGLLLSAGKALLRYPLHTFVALVLGFAVVQSVRLEVARRRNVELALDKLRLEAKADTTRQLFGKAVRAFGAGYVVWQRLVLQERIRRDSIDKALQQERVFRASLQVILRTLRDSITGTPVRVDSNDVRSSRFIQRIQAYTIDATAFLPPPPDSGRLVIDSLTADPLNLKVQLGCGEAKNGVRPAVLTVAGRDSALIRGVRIDSTTADPDACNHRVLEKQRGALRSWLERGISVGAWELLKKLVRMLGGN